jgi:hypothetical protein
LNIKKKEFALSMLFVVSVFFADLHVNKSAADESDSEDIAAAAGLVAE